MSIKFGFDKTASKNAVTESKCFEDEDTSGFGKTGDDESINEFTRAKKRKAQPLIIPLIKRNFYTSNNAVDQEAAKELLSEARALNDDWENRDNGDQCQSSLIVDMLANREQNGDNDAVNFDIRPESSTEEEYDKIPIDGFGMAMLRGMGFKKEEGIGKTFRQAVNPLEVNLRPKGLGLGATAMNGGAQKDLFYKDSDEEAEAEPKVGDFVLVKSGPHKATRGRMMGVDGDTSRVLIKTDEENSIISVAFVHVSNWNGKSQNGVTSSENAKFRKETNGASTKEEMIENSKRDRKERDHKRLEKDTKSSSKKSEKIFLTSSEPWLMEGIRVRVIDKYFKNGRHYKEKVTIVDVASPFQCSCRTDEGVLLDNLPQESLETVIPRGAKEGGCLVKVVRGRHKSTIVEILSMNKQKCQLQALILDTDQILKLSYDDVSELAKT